MAFVLDASVSACWAFADEGHPVADAAFSRIQAVEAVVPALWWFEMKVRPLRLLRLLDLRFHNCVDMFDKINRRCP